MAVSFRNKTNENGIELEEFIIRLLMQHSTAQQRSAGQIRIHSTALIWVGNLSSLWGNESIPGTESGIE